MRTEEQRAKWRVYYARNKERMLAANRAWHDRNPEYKKEYLKKHALRTKKTQKAWREKHGKAAWERKKAKWRSGPEARILSILSKSRRAAPKRGFEFSIGLQDLLPLPEMCPLLGLKLCYTGDKSDSSPSLDRKDSSRGYVPGNVWVVSNRANFLKSNATLGELELLTSNLAKSMKR